MFGEEFFNQEITPKAADEFLKTIQETSVEAVVTFNKEIYNLVSKDHIDTYIEHLKEGELIRSRIIGIDRYVPIFQTFPTGFWRCPRQFRKASLEEIRTAICSELNVPKSEPK
jgi:hypothetical protein